MKRDSSVELDKILGNEIKVLDHGFIKVVDYMGTDSAIADAARLSYGKGTKKNSNDKGLIRYLMRHDHTSPFEMCEIKFHVKMPIFIARQWIRHRTANVNEYSARYSILEDQFYIMDRESVSLQSTTNNQGRGENITDDKTIDNILGKCNDLHKLCYSSYEEFLDAGLSREVARNVLPVSVYTQMCWKIDLHNLLHFLRLRADVHAQYEIREYANAMLDVVKMWVPVTYEAFVDYSLCSYKVSKNCIELINKQLCGEDTSDIEKKISARELSDLERVFKI